MLARTSESEMKKALGAYQGARDEYDRIEGDTFPQRAESMLDVLGLAGAMAAQRLRNCHA